MSNNLKPPAVPSHMLNFFAAQPDFPALAGDMSEEFHQRAQTLGPQSANRWFWREAFRNTWALTVREVARTPVRTMIIALLSILAVNAVTDVYVGITLYRFPFWSPQDLPLHPLWTAVLRLLQVVVPLAVGWIAARSLRGREWALALTYTFISACMALFAVWYFFSLAKQLFPASLREIAIIGNVSRQVFFWMGCLWTRHSLRTRSPQNSIAPDF
jgi:hypothetical protein